MSTIEGSVPVVVERHSGGPCGDSFLVKLGRTGWAGRWKESDAEVVASRLVKLVGVKAVMEEFGPG